MSRELLNFQGQPQHIEERRIKAQIVLVAFTNIDFLGIGKSCNNCMNCCQCFLGEIAWNNGDFGTDLELIKKIKENYPTSSFFYYPAEFATSSEYAYLMGQTGQKAMTNGKEKGISERIIKAGFTKVSFSLYSDQEEMYFFYRYNEKEYSNLLENIGIAVEAGLGVEVFSIVTPLNYRKLPALYSLSEKLGINKISLLPLVPSGKAKQIEDIYFFNQETLENLIEITEEIKREGGPYLSLGIGFGPSKAADRFFSGSNESWVKTKTLCPAINGEYAALNIGERSVYLCFKLLNEPWAEIGSINEKGQIYINNKYDLSSEALVTNLGGLCGDCDIKEKCLGGCRSQAIAFALKDNPELSIEKAIYTGQPFCRYQIK